MSKSLLIALNYWHEAKYSFEKLINQLYVSRCGYFGNILDIIVHVINNFLEYVYKLKRDSTTRLISTRKAQCCIHVPDSHICAAQWSGQLAWECLLDRLSECCFISTFALVGVCLKKNHGRPFQNSKMLDLYKNVEPCVPHEVDFIVFNSF